VNNVLVVLSKLLRVAKRLKVIDALPVESFDVLLQDDASELIAQGPAGVDEERSAARWPQGDWELHVLRHTFCSHLAMRGAPAKVIQELAGQFTCPPRCATCT
jgi:integrase